MGTSARAADGSRTVLVTGASGGVGSAIVRTIAADPLASAVAVDRVPLRMDGPAAGRVKPMIADLRSADLGGLAGDDIDAVVHAAARIPGPVADDAACAADNRAMDDNVLRFCVDRALPVVFFSTASVYPRRTDGAWIGEDDPVEPGGAYAAAKLESEQRFLQAPAPGAAVFRITSPYGPGQQAESVIRRFCLAALRGTSIDVWGSGRREQDFIHVDDIARAVGMALAAAVFPAGLYLIAAGHPTTMAELAAAALRAAGRDTRVRTGAKPDPEDGRTARYRIERARARLGWAPRITLADGVASCLEAWRGTR